jgi:hypothetical protein
MTLSIFRIQLKGSVDPAAREIEHFIKALQQSRPGAISVPVHRGADCAGINVRIDGSSHGLTPLKTYGSGRAQGPFLKARNSS